jgi:hypothetical protein
MTEKSEALLSCPFCGGDAEIRESEVCHDTWFSRCIDCGCRTMTSYSKEEPTATWNTRAVQPAAAPLGREIARVQDTVRQFRDCWHDAISESWQRASEQENFDDSDLNLNGFDEVCDAILALAPAVTQHERGDREVEIVRLIDVLRSDEGDSVMILCDNPDFNGQPNCAIICNGDWTGWVDKRFAADTILDALSMAMVEKNLPTPRKVIATSNGHHWIERFNLVCCRDCGFVRRADDKNSPCKGPAGVGIRQDLATPSAVDREAVNLGCGL